MQKAIPAPAPLGLDTAFVVGALLIVAALVVLTFFPKNRKGQIAAFFSTILGLTMLGFRRKEEKPEEQTKRSEQNDAAKEMDATIEDASAGESPESSDLRAWARKMRDS